MTQRTLNALGLSGIVMMVVAVSICVREVSPDRDSSGSPAAGVFIAVDGGHRQGDAELPLSHELPDFDAPVHSSLLSVPIRSIAGSNVGRTVLLAAQNLPREAPLSPRKSGSARSFVLRI